MRFGGNILFVLPLFSLLLSGRKKKKLRKSSSERMAKGASFISQEQPGKARKLCVPETSNQPQEEKATFVTSGAVPPREGRVLPLRDDPSVGTTTEKSIHGVLERRCSEVSSGTAGPGARPPPRRFPCSPSIGIRGMAAFPALRLVLGVCLCPTLWRNILAVYLKDTPVSRPRILNVL